VSCRTFPTAHAGPARPRSRLSIGNVALSCYGVSGGVGIVPTKPESENGIAVNGARPNLVSKQRPIARRRRASSWVSFLPACDCSTPRPFLALRFDRIVDARLRTFAADFLHEPESQNNMRGVGTHI